MTKKENIRRIALEGFLEITRGGEKFHHVLDGLLTKYAYLPSPDRALLTRILHGTLEKRDWIDWCIASCSRIPVSKIKPIILAILRLSVYQLLFLDRIPDFAVCSEAQNLTAAYRLSGLKGYVNGVLRAIARNREQILSEKDSLPLAVRYSVPEWILEIFRGVAGDEETLLGILDSLEGDPPLTVRVNTSLDGAGRVTEEWKRAGIFFQGIKEPEGLYYLRGFDRPGAIPGVADARVMVQDFSSALCVYLAGIRPGDKILDLCAAPGGKSFYAADRMAGQGLVKSFDIHPGKVAQLEERIRQSSFRGMRADCLDASEFQPSLREWADVVLADVPCSGLGVIGKKPDIKYRVTREDCFGLAALSRRILSHAAEYVKPGGVLLFSTCTLSPWENEENREWFLKEHPSFLPVDFLSRLPDSLKKRERYRTQAAEGYLTLLPAGEDSLWTDGFFISQFRKGGL